MNYFDEVERVKTYLRKIAKHATAMRIVTHNGDILASIPVTFEATGEMCYRTKLTSGRAEKTGLAKSGVFVNKQGDPLHVMQVDCGLHLDTNYICNHDTITFPEGITLELTLDEEPREIGFGPREETY